MQVIWDNGKEFVGSTPTAPFAKLALFIGSLEVTRGLQVRGQAMQIPLSLTLALCNSDRCAAHCEDMIAKHPKSMLPRNHLGRVGKDQAFYRI